MNNRVILTCEVIGFFHVWMKLYTLKNYINKIFPHVNWMWRFSHGTQNHVKFPHFQMWIEYFPMWTIFNCNVKNKLEILVNHVNPTFSHIYFLKCELWIWKCKKKKNVTCELENVNKWASFQSHESQCPHVNHTLSHAMVFFPPDAVGLTNT